MSAENNIKEEKKITNDEVFSFTLLSCNGSANNRDGLGFTELKRNPIVASITVYSDGRRDVGCPYSDIVNGNCRASSDPKRRARCAHLLPLKSENFSSK